jgi:hypothetical protein
MFALKYLMLGLGLVWFGAAAAMLIMDLLELRKLRAPPRRSLWIRHTLSSYTLENRSANDAALHAADAVGNEHQRHSYGHGGRAHLSDFRTAARHAPARCSLGGSLCLPSGAL